MVKHRFILKIVVSVRQVSPFDCKLFHLTTLFFSLLNFFFFMELIGF